MSKLQPQILNGYGFPFFDKYKSICTKQIHNFGINLATIKEYNMYTLNDLSIILGVSKSSLQQVLKNKDNPTYMEYLRIHPAYFALIAEWKDYAENNIPPEYYRRQKRIARQRAYKARKNDQIASLRVVRGGNYEA